MGLYRQRRCIEGTQALTDTGENCVPRSMGQNQDGCKLGGHEQREIACIDQLLTRVYTPSMSSQGVKKSCEIMNSSEITTEYIPPCLLFQASPEEPNVAQLA